MEAAAQNRNEWRNVVCGLYYTASDKTEVKDQTCCLPNAIVPVYRPALPGCTSEYYMPRYQKSTKTVSAIVICYSTVWSFRKT